MDHAAFETMVSRLERESAARPRAYALRVALLAALGFGLLAAMLGMAGLGLLVLAGIAVALLVTGGSAWLWLFKLGKLLLLLAVPLWFLIRSAGKALMVRLPKPEGEELRAQDAPELFAAMAHMRQQLRGPKVHHVWVVDDMNAAIVQRPWFGLFGFPRNHMILGLPLLESMPAQEALAVVAHEYGHLAGAHGHFAAFIYRLRLTWGTIQGLASQWEGVMGRALGRAVGWYAPYFNAYTFVLARANEYQADRAAADVVGAQVMGHALKRSNVAGAHYNAFLDQTIQGISQSPRPPGDLTERWARLATQWPQDATTWLAQALDRQGRVDDTHPMLRARLEALQVGEAQALPPPVAAPSAAQTWLGERLPALRDTFQRQWAERVAEPWARRHEEIQAQHARWMELRQQVELTREEGFECLSLATQLEPETDWRDALAAFNAQHPDHPGALFLEGSCRLEKADAIGVAVMERAMALDGDAVKPGCDRLHAYWKAQGNDAHMAAVVLRWEAHEAFEQRRLKELRALDTTHAVRAHGLQGDELDAVLANVGPAHRKGIAAAYFVRRLLPSDPDLPTYVLALELNTWAKLRHQEGALVDRFATMAWPVHLIVVALVPPYKGYLATVQAVEGALLCRE